MSTTGVHVIETATNALNNYAKFANVLHLVNKMLALHNIKYLLRTYDTRFLIGCQLLKVDITLLLNDQYRLAKAILAQYLL